ncbi:unnamed protein product [Rotaria sp. Silwood1]|nr:unnamed protein product [Rotaria sp. Silwood1]CAF3333650.1 unnamed protein product [Rotaria sp. Silwood1]CAF3349961.1 unnamed protein product [Rotaria sp. Silwood1]CAF3354977.1 unnamed protein product [Rotaria sp. Silwood1]CAF4545667.1 unnamed protein product [Rotaria sp. Silwood1]
MKENIQQEETIRRQWWKKYNDIKQYLPYETNLILAWQQWDYMNRSSLLKEFILYEKRKHTQRLNMKSKQINDLVKLTRNMNEPLQRPIMLPVEPTVGHLLYHGVTGDNSQIDYSTGRQTYLKLRKQLAPDEKFSYPITSSMDITWRIEDFYARNNDKMQISNKNVHLNQY